jgi:hypothetical protein
MINKEEKFLKENLYYGLTDLNYGFDNPKIWYFNKEDFEILLDRVEKLKIGIRGIECCPNGRFAAVKVHELYGLSPFDPKWYRTAFQELLDDGFGDYFSVSFIIPENIKY